MALDRYIRDTSFIYNQIESNSPVEELGGLTKQHTIKGYHGTAYGGIINKKLRTGAKLYNKEVGTVTMLDGKMELTKSPMEIDREVNDNYFREVGLEFDDITELVGKTFQDKGFVSTSYKPNLEKDSKYSYFGGRPMFMVIRVPQGTPAMLTDNNEYEITLGRDLKFHITAMRIDTDTKPLLTVDIIK